MRKWIILLTLATFCLVGCNKGANNASYDLRKDKSAPQYMSNRNTNKIVGNDVNNQNPNFLPLRGTKEGTVSTQGERMDVNKAKQIIGNTDEFLPGSIWINGNQMWVTAYKKGIVTQREKIAAEAKLHRRLIKALPRYQIEVNVQQDRR